MKGNRKERNKRRIRRERDRTQGKEHIKKRKDIREGERKKERIQTRKEEDSRRKKNGKTKGDIIKEGKKDT